MQDDDLNGGTRARRREHNGASIQAIDRAARMLGIFSEQELELSLGQLTERFGLGKTTTHRYATSLRQCGLLRYDQSSGRYSLGIRLVQLGRVAQGGLHVAEVAAPHMERIANELNETAALSIWDGDGAVVVRTAEAPRRLPYIGVRIGSRLPGESAQSRIFLAYLDPQAAEKPELATILEHGSVVSNTSDGEIRAVGCPIFQGSQPVAAIAVVGTPRRIPEDPRSDLALYLKRIANRISHELGEST